MEINATVAAYGPFFSLVAVLIAAAMVHPEPQVRARAERLLAMIFRSH
ncbi:hypothetical protein ABZV77_05505 [Streptomyces sp. NPDC004732]